MNVAPRRRAPMRAMFVTATGRCPACGTGRLFSNYLKVTEHCGACGEELHHHRADDVPPYFTIFLVGHVLVPLVLLVEKAWRPAIAVHMAVWLPLALALTLVLLPAVKGSIVGLQWALYMHGFAVRSKCRPSIPAEDDGEDEGVVRNWTT